VAAIDIRLRSMIIPSREATGGNSERLGALIESNQVDSTWWSLVRSIAWLSVSSNDIGCRPKAAAGSGLLTMTSLRRPRINGRARPDGIGVTRLTQYELSLGVSTGTGIISRRSPRWRA